MRRTLDVMREMLQSATCTPIGVMAQKSKCLCVVSRVSPLSVGSRERGSSNGPGDNR